MVGAADVVTHAAEEAQVAVDFRVAAEVAEAVEVVIVVSVADSGEVAVVVVSEVVVVRDLLLSQEIKSLASDVSLKIRISMPSLQRTPI